MCLDGVGPGSAGRPGRPVPAGAHHTASNQATGTPRLPESDRLPGGFSAEERSVSFMLQRVPVWAKVTR